MSRDPEYLLAKSQGSVEMLLLSVRRKRVVLAELKKLASAWETDAMLDNGVAAETLRRCSKQLRDVLASEPGIVVPPPREPVE